MKSRLSHNNHPFVVVCITKMQSTSSDTLNDCGCWDDKDGFLGLPNTIIFQSLYTLLLLYIYLTHATLFCVLWVWRIGNRERVNFASTYAETEMQVWSSITDQMFLWKHNWWWMEKESSFSTRCPVWFKVYENNIFKLKQILLVGIVYMQNWCSTIKLQNQNK